jgi:hypothetical protein
MTATSVMWFGGLQTGGMVGRSGAYLVGERGPEIAYLPRGSFVYPSASVPAMHFTLTSTLGHPATGRKNCREGHRRQGLIQGVHALRVQDPGYVCAE